MFTNFYSQAAFQALAHGTFQGVMTEMNGGNFISGFAAGALSSIASSAWQGGMSSETVGNLTTETYHQGLSGAMGAGNGFGTICFGTIAGGAGAALTGGNFWQGAVTGLFVSALNHTIHRESNPKTGLTKRQFIKDANGNVTGEKLIYLKKGVYREINGTLHNGKLLYNHALNEPVKDGVLTVFAHGNRFNINYRTTTKDIQSMFKSDSVMWNNFKSNGGNLTMDLKSCSTGIEGKGLNISQALTHMNYGLTIYAPANYYNYNGTITNNAGYNKYYNGSNVDWSQNR